LIPGAGGHAAYWNRLIPELEARVHRPIAVDIEETTDHWTWMDSPPLWKLQWVITRTSSSSPSRSQEDNPPPPRRGERSMQITAPDH